MHHFKILIILILSVSVSLQVYASPSPLNFKTFLQEYQQRSGTILSAKQNLINSENIKVQNSDQWQARLTATPDLSFNDRKFESGGGENISNRSQSITGLYTQSMPTGTSLQLSGQKFIENQNPLFQSIDRSYSLKLTQDLIKNSFGQSQRAQMKRAKLDFKVAEMNYRQAQVQSCEEAFKLYSDTFIQQEITLLLQSQLKDAKNAQKVSRKLYRDRLINELDKLSSESDFINTQIRTEQAEQLLINNKRQMTAFMPTKGSPLFNLSDPSLFLGQLQPRPSATETFSEVIVSKQLHSQELAVTQARSDRWTDLQLGIEAGEKLGRARSGSNLFRFNEDYLQATLTIGFDVINNTENSNLKTAISIKNNLAIQKETTQKTQKSLLNNLLANHNLLEQQTLSSKKQVSLLKRKMKLAFNQMKRAKLDFETYLLHRNAYINQKINYLNLTKDLWLNHFSIQKEFAHKNQTFCEV